MIKLSLRYRRYFIYIIPVIAAAIAREFTYMQWYHSPFRFYHIISGLDMQTFVMRGESLYNGTTSFSMYKFFIAAIYAVFGKEHLAEGVVAAQMLLGVLTTGLTVYIYRHIFRNRTGALLAGLFTALYAPLIVYETQVLKEPLFLSLSIIALASIVYARTKHFTPLTSYITGITAILPFFIRFSGLAWLCLIYLWLITYSIKKRNIWKPLAMTMAGSLTVIIIISTYNLKHNHSMTRYLTPNTTYLLGVGAKPNTKDLNLKTPEQDIKIVNKNTKWNYIKVYISKIPYIFTGYEQPNNINYYFVCNKLPLLKWFIGSSLLIPISITGMIMILIYFKKEQKTLILFLYIIAFMVPMIIFLPLARYKMALTPIFAIFAAWYIVYMLRILHAKERHYIAVPTLILISSFMISTYTCRGSKVRSSDKKAHGIAASYIPDKLMKIGRFEEASEMLEKEYIKNPDNPYIMINYVSSLMGIGEPKKAEKIMLKQKRIEDPALLGRFFYELAECTCMLNHLDRSVEYYNAALQLPIAAKQKKFIMKKIAMIRRIQQSKK